jgi:penicillin-binding protein 1A
VETVRDREGKILYRNAPRREEVLSPEVSWILTTMLRDVNLRGTGAAVGAAGLQHPTGGKTGTTNDYTDARYVGFTKAYTAGVWVGIDDYSPMGPGNTGSANALPMWIDLMRSAMHGRAPQDFPRPEGVEEVSLCPVSGLRAQFYCPDAYTDYYDAGSAPDACTPFQHLLHRRPESEPESVPPEAPPKKEDPRLRKTF